MMAGVNNDSLSELIIAIGLWQVLRSVNKDPRLKKLEVGVLGFWEFFSALPSSLNLTPIFLRPLRLLCCF